MSIEPKRLAAVFFAPRDGEETTCQLLARAGATDIVVEPTNSADRTGLVDCRWAGMACKGFLETRSYFQLLIIYFWQSQFLELMPDNGGALPLESDPALPLALSFRDSCIALQPEVAFIATHLDQAQLGFIHSLEALVLVKDANALADLRLGLLYLNANIARYWTPDPVRDDRDSLPVPSGLLVFAGRGPSRWF